MNRTIFLVSFNFTIFLLYMISFFTDRASNNGICFGIRLPKEYMDNKQIKSLKKKYRIIVSTVFVLVFITFNSIVFFGNYSSKELETIFVTALVTTIILFNISYFPYYFKVKALKRKNSWTREKKNVVVTDTTLIKPSRKEKIRTISNKYFCIILIIPMVLSILTYVKSKDLPVRIQIPGSNYGVFDRTTFVGIIRLYCVPLYEVISWMFMCFINYIIIKAKPDLNSGCIEKAVIRKKKFRRVNSIFIFVLTICMMILLSIKQLELLYNSNLLSLYNNLNILVTVITLIFLIQLIKIGQGGRHISSDEEDDELYKDDDDKWFLGEMYFNPKDPAWIVEKRIGIGWTVNFGNRKSWFIFFATMTILVALKIIL